MISGFLTWLVGTGFCPKRLWSVSSSSGPLDSTLVRSGGFIKLFTDSMRYMYRNCTAVGRPPSPATCRTMPKNFCEIKLMLDWVRIFQLFCSLLQQVFTSNGSWPSFPVSTYLYPRDLRFSTIATVLCRVILKAAQVCLVRKHACCCWVSVLLNADQSSSHVMQSFMT